RMDLTEVLINIIVLDDDDEEESPQPSHSASTSSTQPEVKSVSHLKAQQPVPTHITKSPFASAKKDTHVLQAENQRLFNEFVDHCSALTQDCPEVLTFLQSKYSKASPDYLSSVEFRNSLGRCLTRAQTNRSKTFVYINELCTVLKQHAFKKRQIITKVEPGHCTSTSNFLQSTSFMLESKEKTKTEVDKEEDRVTLVAEEQESEKKEKRASRKQIAYLENLLKLYNDEIRRLQQAELSLDDLGCEDSLYIQEHKLKRKMMKIYEKLCELKGCNTLTGRVIEQRISYKSTRYPEINKKVSWSFHVSSYRNPPDYQDILQQVLRANERYSLCLSRKQLNQMAKEAFREIGTHIQERRHLDLVYNFGSHLTDTYKPATDPALSEPSLLRKLRTNREVALSRLEEVISKYAIKQEDTEEQERTKRLEKIKENKELNGLAEQKKKEVEVEENEEEGEEENDDEEEEDESSDPDIEEEIQASTQQDGPVDNNPLFTLGKLFKHIPGFLTQFYFISFPLTFVHRSPLSEVDIPVDMGVFSCNSPPQAESTRAYTPTQEMVSSSQLTPPPKKNKVNVATQCDPDEIIVLSDSE
uniref:Death domain-associated protein 6 n=1 Tax=Mola mola TaxID=94237 RepID=A0A3Q4BFG1_MOLML